MNSSTLKTYLSQTKDPSTSMVAYLANLEKVAEVSPEVAKSIVQEFIDQRNNLKLIAPENFTSLSTQAAMGNLLTDKYAEGFPFHRFYAGCDNVDNIEARAVKFAKQIFNAEHAYVQPHSGADANLIAYWAILNAKVTVPELEKIGDMNPAHLSKEDWEGIREKLGNQKLLGLDYYSGGHLTHGYRMNISAMMFEAHTYSVNKETNRIDYDAIEKQAKEIKPLILLTGYSAYPRKINFKRMKEIADKVGAVFMVDMAHFAGLVAGGVFEGDYNPFPHADVVTTTIHKTLRGPRGGMILCKKEFAEHVDKGCPLVAGGPLPHMMAAKAIALQEASLPEFKEYAKKIAENADTLAKACIKEGIILSTNGTDNHLMLIDVTPFGINGRQAALALRDCGITSNRNALPYDKNGPWYTSGVRIGTPATTTLGMGGGEMKEIAAIIKLVLENISPKIVKTKLGDTKKSKSKYTIDESAQKEARGRVSRLLERFVLYPELDVEVLKEVIG